MVEVEAPKTLEEDAPKKRDKKRAGRTTITSISLSDEFREIVDKHELSPTDVFRRGVAVTLADMGVSPYNTQMNNDRLEAVKSKLDLDKMELLVKDLEKVTSDIKRILETTA